MDYRNIPPEITDQILAFTGGTPRQRAQLVLGTGKAIPRALGVRPRKHMKRLRLEQEKLDREIGSVVFHQINDLPMVGRLLDQGANPNAEFSAQGRRPLIWLATYHEFKPMVYLLLKEGANPNVESFPFGQNIENEAPTTPLMQASYNQDPDIIDLLIEFGADVNYYTQLNHESALMNALIYNNSRGVENLVNRGAVLKPEDVELIWSLIQERNLFYEPHDEEHIRNMIKSIFDYQLGKVLPGVAQVANTRGRKLQLQEEISLLPPGPSARKTQNLPSRVGEIIRSRRVKRGGRPVSPRFGQIPTFPGGQQYLEAETRFGGLSPRRSPIRARSPRREMIRRRVQEARSPSKKRTSPRGRSL